MSLLVWNSNRISLIVQFITGIIGIYGLSIPLDKKDVILKDVLSLELIVQIIEFLFYIGFLSVLNVVSLTQFRYYDWFLSTPVMLFTTSLYFFYTNFIETQETFETKDGEKEEKPIGMFEFAKQHQRPLFTILGLNFLMLLFGFLAELGMIDRQLGFVLGTAALFGSFYTIYDNFAKYSKKTTILFSIMFVLWSCYGIFFLFPPVIKNVGYTTLDILAKNFFGLFLSYVIYTKKVIPTSI